MVLQAHKTVTYISLLMCIYLNTIPFATITSLAFSEKKIQEQEPWWEPLVPPLLTPPQWGWCSSCHQDSLMIQCCHCLSRVPSEWCLSGSLTSPGLPVSSRSEELICWLYFWKNAFWEGFKYTNQFILRT